MLRLESSADAMGSTFSVVLYGEDREKLESAADEALREALRLDGLLSNYKPDSEWSRVNREAGEHPVAVSAELFELLSKCAGYSRASEGAFDITVAPLMKVWGFYKGSGHLAAASDVAQAMKYVGFERLELKPASRSVFFTRRGVELDPGGIGKGYAVDRMAEILKKDGVRAALVSAGGSSIYGFGETPGEAGWRVRIEDPRERFRTAAEVVLKNESLSSSGSSEKFFVADGKTWSHIMDPRTGFPAQGALAVSVIAPRTLDSEAWTKPYFINGRQWTASHKPGDYRVFYCEDKADQQCAWLQ